MGSGVGGESRVRAVRIFLRVWSRSTSRASIFAILWSVVSSDSLSMERKESLDDSVSRGEEGAEDCELVESDAGEANWTMMC